MIDQYENAETLQNSKYPGHQLATDKGDIEEKGNDDENVKDG